MRLRTLLLFAAALVALLGFAWFASGSGGSTPQEHLTRSGEEAQELVPDTALTPATMASSEPGGTSKSAASEREVVAPEAEATPEREATQRSIVGRVVDSLGVPVRDARIFVAQRSTFSTGSLEALADSGSGFVDVDRTTSGDRGHFRLESSMRGELDFEVRAPGFAPLREMHTIEGAEQAQVGDLLLEPGMRLAGRVVDTEGNGLSGVEIHESRQQAGGMSVNIIGGSSTPLATSGAGGVFEINELASGPFNLRLEHDNHPGLRVNGLTAEASRSLTDQVYVMQDGHRIRGMVQGLESGDHKRYAVRARADDMESEDIAVGISGGRMGEISADGQFEVHGLHEGQYTLQVVENSSTLPMFAPGRSSAVRTQTGSEDVELLFREPMGLTFQVVDANSGLPRTKFRVEQGQGFLMPMRDGDGEPLLEHPEGRVSMDDLTPQGGLSTTNLKISVEGYSPLHVNDVALVPGEVVDLGILRAQPVPLIAVEVLDAETGEPVEGARVSFTEMPEESAPGERRMSFSIGGDDEDEAPDMASMMGAASTRAKTDKDGVAEVPSLPGKRCVMKVTHRGYADHAEPNIELPETGSDAFDVRLYKGGTVVVTVLDSNGVPKSGVRVRESLVGAGGPRRMGGPGTRKSRSDGSVTFKHLTEGEHKFEIAEDTGGGFISMDTQIVIGGMEGAEETSGEVVLVSEGSTLEVTLHARPEGNLHGTLTEADVPLSGASISFEEKKDDSGAPDMGRMMMPGFGGGGTATRSDGNGDFQQEGLKVGTYTVTVEHPSRVMPMEFEVDIREGDNSHDLDLPVAILEGRVLDSNGEAVVGVEVRPERFVTESEEQPQRTMVMAMVVTDGAGGGEAISFSSGGPQNPATRTDEEGRYSLRGVTPDVELVVVSSSDRYQEAKSKPVEVGEDQTRSDVDLAVFESGSLRILVRDSAGNESGHCLARLEFAGQAEPMPAAAREFIGETGEGTARSLRPGVWRVTAESMGLRSTEGGSDSGPTTTDAVEVEVLAGETVEVLLTMPQG